LDQENTEFMKAYTVAEVSKQIDVPAGTIRQWEKSLEGTLTIPRDEKGARYYTDFEIAALRNIKTLRDRGLSFEAIRGVLNNSEEYRSVAVPSAPAMTQAMAIQTIQSLQQTVETLNSRMETIVQEAVRNEVSTLSEALNRQQEYIEQSLESRDQKLMQALREMQEQRQQAAVGNEKKKWWKFGK
jgi:DNA-binding transcriptional MerR regulator